MEKHWRLVICQGCVGDGAGLHAAVRDALPAVPVSRVGCLGVCRDPITLAAQGDGRATYVFSGLEPGDAGDVAAFAAAYDAAPGGWIADARPLGALRFKLVARVPAMVIPSDA